MSLPACISALKHRSLGTAQPNTHQTASRFYQSTTSYCTTLPNDSLTSVLTAYRSLAQKPPSSKRLGRDCFLLLNPASLPFAGSLPRAAGEPFSHPRHINVPRPGPSLLGPVPALTCGRPRAPHRRAAAARGRRSSPGGSMAGGRAVAAGGPLGGPWAGAGRPLGGGGTRESES